MKCAVKYPISLFHSKYGDRYPIVLTRIKEKSPNLREETVGRSGPKATAERFRSFITYHKVREKMCRSSVGFKPTARMPPSVPLSGRPLSSLQQKSLPMEEVLLMR